MDNHSHFPVFHFEPSIVASNRLLNVESQEIIIQCLLCFRCTLDGFCTFFTIYIKFEAGEK